jgi:hypothetical protein
MLAIVLVEHASCRHLVIDLPTSRLPFLIFFLFSDSATVDAARFHWELALLDPRGVAPTQTATHCWYNQTINYPNITPFLAIALVFAERGAVSLRNSESPFPVKTKDRFGYLCSPSLPSPTQWPHLVSACPIHSSLYLKFGVAFLVADCSKWRLRINPLFSGNFPLSCKRTLKGQRRTT